MARVLIDGRFVGVGDSMTRYILELLRRIVKLDRENSYTLLVRPQGEGVLSDYPEIIEAENLSIDVLDIKHYSLAEQTKLLDYLNAGNYDLVHFIQFNHPVRYKKNYVITIHDLTMVGYLHRQNFLKRLAFAWVMRSAAKDSTRIITISDTSKREIEEYYHVNPEKISAIYLGIDHERYNEQVKGEKSKVEGFKEKYGISDDYILYTGMWKKHKNLVRLLQAYEIYIKTQNSKLKTKEGDAIQLVLVGKRDEREVEVIQEIERINNFAIKQYGKKVIVTTGFVEEQDLPLAYAGARAYVIPSLSEGFGWPPLEAMACGVPVASSNVSCMPEVLGDAPLYFDPYNVDEMATAIGTIVSNDSVRSKCVEKGLEQVKKYSWDMSAEQVWKVYKSILG